MSDSSDPMRCETDGHLIKMTQEYLEEQFRGVAPHSVLVRAWEQFYRVYNQILRSFAHSRGVSEENLEDCLQEVWSAVITELPKFKYDPNRGRFRSWLYTLVRNKANDQFRRRTHLTMRHLSDNEVRTEPTDKEIDPALICEHLWDRQVVQAVMADLRRRVSQMNYDVLLMRRIEQRSVAEVAKTLGITPEVVRSRQHRTEQKLRTLMNLYTGGEFSLDR